jgi:hypothetical protein
MLDEVLMGRLSYINGEASGNIKRGRRVGEYQWRGKMKTVAYVVAFLILFASATGVFAAGFKVYPGAKVEDVYETKQSEAGAKMSRAPKVIIFTTNDLFENVVAFYRGSGREYRIPGSSGKPIRLPSGQELKEAYFIFDNAGDIMTSKHWIKIQQPYLSRERTKEGFQGKYGAVREVTAIIEEDKRTYP